MNLKNEWKRVKLKITTHEFIFSFSIGILGFFVTSKTFILFLNQLPILLGFLAYYLFIFVILGYLAWLGLDKARKTKMNRIVPIIGTAIIGFAVFTVINWENAYIQYITEGNFDGASDIFYGTEDGITWSLVSSIIHTENPTDYLTLKRIIAFSILPFIECLIGTALVNKIEIK